ncbi:MAG: hypothetical protein J0M12_17635, partial [Deltaproteobacteria bacterium]|nr:hypothetical protein [Deltaproteobacteria bacterium]
LSDLSIKCALQNKGLVLTASNISIGRNDKSLSYNDLSIQLGNSRARGLGSIQYVETAQSPIQGSSELTEVQAEFEELGVMLKSLGISGMPAGLKGTLSGKLKISLTDAKAVQGDVSVSNFAYGKDLKAGLLSLTNVSVQLSGSSLQKVSANSAAKNLFIRNGTDEYSAGSLQGDLLFIAGSAWKFSSNKMSFGGFGYSDQETTLREVNADLKTISVGANARGDIDATAQLSGYALKLQHLEAKGSTNPPDLEIKQIGSAEAPLRLKLPSSGGYELSGTMNVKDGALVWQKRDFQKINGSIRALISGPLKKFEAIPLQFIAEKESGSLRGAFEMTAAEFKLSDTTLSAFGGVTTVGVSLGREGRRELRSTTSIRNVDAGRAIPLVSPQDAGAFVGTLKQAALVFNARWGDFKRSATGSGSVEVLQGDVKKFDLTRVLGNALSAIPGVSISKGSSSRGDGPESPAQSSRAEFQIQPNLVIINSMELQRDSYSVRGSGTADFEGHISATARVTFLKENLGMLGSGLQAVTSLLGGLGRIDIPILISGKIPEVSINVDMSTFLREKSGLTTAESVIGTTGDILGGIGRAVLSPFGGSGNSKKSKSQ